MSVSFTYTTSAFTEKKFAKHHHEDYSISLITKGVNKLYINSKYFEACESDIRIINPNEVHSIEKSSWSHISIAPSKTYIDSISPYPNIKFCSIIQEDKAKKLFISLFNALENEKDKTEIDAKALDFFSFLIENYSDKDIKPVQYSNKSIQDALIYIHQNIFKHDFTIDSLIQSLSISKFHFIRTFKKETGISPYKYIQNLKIIKARSLLSSGRSLSFIALECGFYDQSHLIKVYRQFYGHTPSQVRKHSMKKQ